MVGPCCVQDALEIGEQHVHVERCAHPWIHRSADFLLTSPLSPVSLSLPFPQTRPLPSASACPLLSATSHPCACLQRQRWLRRRHQPPLSPAMACCTPCLARTGLLCTGGLGHADCIPSSQTHARSGLALTTWRILTAPNPSNLITCDNVRSPPDNVPCWCNPSTPSRVASPPLLKFYLEPFQPKTLSSQPGHLCPSCSNTVA